jgi:TolB protein
MLPIAGGAYADQSRDSTWLVFTKMDGGAEQVYVAPTNDVEKDRLLLSSPATVPMWSPDGQRITFSPDRSYSKGVFIINADGSGERRLTSDGGWPVWFPDGRRIGYLVIGARGDQEYRVVDVASGATHTLPVTLRGTNMPFFPTPDGRAIAYSNSVHLSDEIWLLRPAAR